MKRRGFVASLAALVVAPFAVSKDTLTLEEFSKCVKAIRGAPKRTSDWVCRIEGKDRSVKLYTEDNWRFAIKPEDVVRIDPVEREERWEVKLSGEVWGIKTLTSDHLSEEVKEYMDISVLEAVERNLRLGPLKDHINRYTNMRFDNIAMDHRPICYRSGIQKPYMHIGPFVS